MKQKNVLSSARSGVGTGTTSLLMIFTVLCFATLAMLSLSTTAANQRIQQRGMDNATATAVARGVVAREVAALDAQLVTLQSGATGEDTYLDEALALIEGAGWTEVDDATVQLVTPVDEQNELLTEIRINPPGEAERYTVLRQVTRLSAGWEPEEGTGLWEGA